MEHKQKIEDFKNIIIKEYSEGKSLKEICNIIGFYPKKVSDYLKSIGLKPNKYHKSKKVNEHYFDVIDTEEKAYFLGFFIADGCIREEYDKRTNSKYTRLCFSNSIDDSEIIEKIHEIICPENKIQKVHNTKGAKNRKEQLTLQWTSRIMVKTLETKYGIKPKKTFDTNYKFPFETIDRKFHKDFIRGFIDGDGSISKEDIRFSLNSKKFGEQIVDILYNEVFLPNKELIYDFNYSITEVDGKTTKYWRLRFPMGHGKYKFYKKYLYESASVFLNRKKVKLD